MKLLVYDTRTNRYYFGEVVSLDEQTEKAFGIEKTDVIQVGDTTRKVVLPVSACVLYPEINAIEDASMVMSGAINVV